MSEQEQTQGQWTCVMKRKKKLNVIHPKRTQPKATSIQSSFTPSMSMSTSSTSTSSVSTPTMGLPSTSLVTPPPESVSEHFLQDSWTLWVHDLSADQWDLPSYEEVFTFHTSEDFWRMFNSLKNLNNRMYYLMRKGYPPLWDHPSTIGGGGWTFKVDKKQVRPFFETLACFCIGETIGARPQEVIGVSISPKIKFATIRLWTRNVDHDPTIFNKLRRETHGEIDFETARFTPNVDASK